MSLGLFLGVSLLVFTFGFFLGVSWDEKLCADESIKVQPARWWSRCLIDAKARAEKRKLDGDK